jgi:hypothetical protein
MEDTSGIVDHFLIAQVRKPAACLVLDDQRYHARPHGQQAGLVAHQPFQHREKIAVWHGPFSLRPLPGDGPLSSGSSSSGVPAPTLAKIGIGKNPCHAHPPRQRSTYRHDK